VNFDHFYLNT